MKISPCPNCRGKTLFKSKQVSSGGGHAPNYLPGLGSGFKSGRFEVIVCRDCGYSRFFASPDALRKLSDAKQWKRVVPTN
jgi:predicted nucleic-acid-binding Zn-ribbon protein